MDSNDFWQLKLHDAVMTVLDKGGRWLTVDEIVHTLQVLNYGADRKDLRGSVMSALTRRADTFQKNADQTWKLIFVQKQDEAPKPHPSVRKRRRFA